jgi:hypothetical protein
MTGDEIQRLDDNGGKLLETLVSAFPHGVTLRDGSFRPAFCSEKPHSIVNSGWNYRFMGRSKNYNTAAPETRHKQHNLKQTKRKVYKTNNHCTVGRSLLLNNMDVEAERQLSFLHDKRGSFIYITLQSTYVKCARKLLNFENSPFPTFRFPTFFSRV